MAEAGVDIIADKTEIGNRATVPLQIFLNGVGVFIALRGQTKRGERVFVQSRGKAFVDPISQFRTICGDAREEFFVLAFALRVPWFASGVMRTLEEMDFAFDGHE